MSNFTQKDLEIVEKWGNKIATEYWMSDWNKTLYPIPEKSNTVRMKEFMKLKYENKRFMDKQAAEEAEEGHHEHKKSHKKKKQDSDKEDSSEEEEEQKKYKKKKVKNIKPPEPVVQAHP